MRLGLTIGIVLCLAGSETADVCGDRKRRGYVCHQLQGCVSWDRQSVVCAVRGEQAEEKIINELTGKWRLSVATFFPIKSEVLPDCDYVTSLFLFSWTLACLLSHFPISSDLLLACLQEIHETASSLSRYMLETNEGNFTTLFS